MFLTTLPPVSASMNGTLPLSASWTSFFLPKIAEQGFNVPVRAIDGDYLPAFRNRINILLKQEAVQRGLYNYHHLSKPFSPTQSAPPPFGNALPSFTVRSLYQVDERTAEGLVNLLRLKDGRDLEPLGLTFPDGLRTLATRKEDERYLLILHDLESMGIIAGISYFYNEGPFASSYPPRKDVRTIHVDGRRLLQTIKKTQKQVLDSLNAGAPLDADAVPLHEVFEKALQNGKLDKIRGMSAASNTFATHAVAGRDSAVGSVTKVTVF